MLYSFADVILVRLADNLSVMSQATSELLFLCEHVKVK